jgi:hypothetical protein
VRGHEAADADRGADEVLVSEFLSNAAVAIAAVVALENGDNLRAEGLVGNLRRRGGSGMIIGAARQAEDGANAASGVAGGAVDVLD